MPFALTPAYGVTSMSFRPGCHRPFRRSACLRSLLLLSQDCVLSSFGSVSFVSAILDHLYQHVLASSVVTLRPFALYLPSWRVLLCGCGGNRTLAHPSVITCCSCGGRIYPLPLTGFHSRHKCPVCCNHVATLKGLSSPAAHHTSPWQCSSQSHAEHTHNECSPFLRSSP